MFDDPEALTELAQRSFHEAKRRAIAENDRLGIPSYGGKDGKIVVRQPPLPPDPWLEATFHDVCDRMRAMIEGRGDRLFSAEENRRYDELERELAEISAAMSARRSL